MLDMNVFFVVVPFFVFVAALIPAHILFIIACTIRDRHNDSRIATARRFVRMSAPNYCKANAFLPFFTRVVLPHSSASRDASHAERYTQFVRNAIQVCSICSVQPTLLVGFRRYLAFRLKSIELATISNERVSISLRCHDKCVAAPFFQGDNGQSCADFIRRHNKSIDFILLNLRSTYT